jgi:AAA+ ATPase superfamily predicted ATPase
VSEDLAIVNSKKKHAELQRFLKLPKNQSFFLFGPRGSGKSTLINNNFNNSKTMLLNLLDPVLEERLIRNPSLLIEMINAAGKSINHLITH